ncbi:MAG: hypothetical protein JSR50_11555 [Proteobacteria bacterium]|nr:hypothetical protein [Pseudomonadota bacterium]
MSADIIQFPFAKRRGIKINQDNVDVLVATIEAQMRSPNQYEGEFDPRRELSAEMKILLADLGRSLAAKIEARKKK